MKTFRIPIITLFVLCTVGFTTIAAPFAASAQDAAPATQSSEKSSLVSNDDCSGLITGTFHCWIWKPAMSLLGSLLLDLGGSILYIAGFFFDTALDLLVVNFQKTLDAMNITAGIQTAWQLFRDLANIAIIGVFVFVAIMTILGSTEYGAKRLVARVLIVAVLINFSLLFSRVIVEGTNFVSGQFARSMPGNAQQVGVAQSFLEAFGIGGLWTGTKVLTDRVAEGTNSGWAPLLYGLVGMITLLTISGVLLYGAVMICARALLLVMILITSSLAFASFLLPQSAGWAFVGWTNWWSNLLKAALFGPILMIFLWIAKEIVARGNVATGAGEAIGKLANDPQSLDANAWQQIIFLIIGTGILFIGIRAASSFSASIGIMGSTRGLAGLASLLPVSLAARMGALLGQQTLGRASLLASQRLLEAGKRQEEGSRAQKMYDFGSRQLMNAASRNFNALNTSLSKQFQKEIGVRTGALVGKNLKGFAGSESRKVDRNAELGERMKMTEVEALKQAMKENPGLANKHDETRGVVESSEKAVKDLVQQQAKTAETFEKNIQSLNAELKKTQGEKGGLETQNKAAELERRIENERASHKAEMNEQANRIATAREKLDSAQSEHKAVTSALKELAPKTTSAAEIGRKATMNSFTAALERTLGMSDMTERRADAVAKRVGENVTNKSVRATLANLTQQQASQTAVLKPSTPSTPQLPHDNTGGAQKAS